MRMRPIGTRLLARRYKTKFLEQGRHGPRTLHDNCTHAYPPSNQFWVHRDRIRQRPRAYYARLFHSLMVTEAPAAGVGEPSLASPVASGWRSRGGGSEYRQRRFGGFFLEMCAPNPRLACTQHTCP